MKHATLSAIGALLLLTSVSLADSIDFGRGALPITIPAGYSAERPGPLVLLIHGYTSSGEGQNKYLKIGALADEYGFFFVAPDGTVEKEKDKNRFWNASNACCDFQGSKVDDSAYLRRIIDEMKSRYSIDARRVFLMGHSNGGFMVHRMAMDHPETIAGIVALNGAAPPKLLGPRPYRPVNVLHIHGTADELNDYKGGDIYGARYPGARESAASWAAFAWGASFGVDLPERIDIDSSLEGKETVVTQWADGHVELWTIEEGGHIPRFPEGFNRRVIEWMYAHPKGM